jgi:DNA-binding response OmpR family regulator
MGEKILVVDDDSHIRALETKILEKRGYRVDQAVDGQDAMMRLDADGYSALVLDLQMPKASGFDVIDHLAKKNPVMISKTVIATAFPREANAVRLQDVCRILVKPFDIHEFVSAVEECTRLT